jgi:hypothetical protein
VWTCVLDEDGATVVETAAPSEGDGLRGLARRLEPLGVVRAAIESMNGARFVHDTLELCGSTSPSMTAPSSDWAKAAAPRSRAPSRESSPRRSGT